MIIARIIAFFSLLFVINANTTAATKIANLNINITFDPYVKLIGTAPGATRVYDNDDIANWIFPSVVDLGTLGVESNLNGNCNINFSTINNFKLLHEINGAHLTKYKLLYESEEFSEISNPTLILPCNTSPTIFQFVPTQIVWPNIFPSFTMQHGIYEDTVTMVVTTQ
jgi:hypothetical protein